MGGAEALRWVRHGMSVSAAVMMPQLEITLSTQCTFPHPQV